MDARVRPAHDNQIDQIDREPLCFAAMEVGTKNRGHSARDSRSGLSGTLSILPSKFALSTKDRAK
jgi:hypothetical protein